MKISKENLKQIIQEEIELILTNAELEDLYGEDLESLLREKDLEKIMFESRYSALPAGGTNVPSSCESDEDCPESRCVQAGDIKYCDEPFAGKSEEEVKKEKEIEVQKRSIKARGGRPAVVNDVVYDVSTPEGKEEFERASGYPAPPRGFNIRLNIGEK